MPPAGNNSALSLKLKSLQNQNSSQMEARPTAAVAKPQLTFEKTATGSYKLVKAKCRSQEPVPREQQPGPGSYLMKVNWAAAKETPESMNALAWKPQ